jgi:hypothetical protein
MDQAQKDNLRKKSEARWRKAEKYAKILDAPKTETYENLTVIDKYSKQVRFGSPYYINLVFQEGKWSDEVKNKARIKYESIVEERKQEMNQETYLKKKYSSLNQDQNPKKEDEDRDPIEDLKLMLWVIKKIGSLEKAEKLFQAAKLALNSMEID